MISRPTIYSLKPLHLGLNVRFHLEVGLELKAGTRYKWVAKEDIIMMITPQEATQRLCEAAE